MFVFFYISLTISCKKAMCLFLGIYYFSRTKLLYQAFGFPL